MIKINLLRNRMAHQGGETEIGTAIEQGLGRSENSSLLTNFALLFGGAILLYMYQTYNLSNLNKTFAEKNILLTASKEKVGKLRENSEKAQKAQEKVKAIEKRMEIIKKLSKSRLSELKALDYLQTVIPDRVWFTKINYSKKSFTFEGFALSDNDFNMFITRLETGGLLSNIIPVRLTEETSSKGKGKSFTVTCQLENI